MEIRAWQVSTFYMTAWLQNKTSCGMFDPPTHYSTTAVGQLHGEPFSDA